MSRRFKISHNQLALPFGEIDTRNISFEDRQRFFWLLVSISVFSLFIYVYAINATAHNIAIRQNLEREVADIGVRLSSLEFASIELKNAVTIETAHAYGFKEVRQPLYVSRGISSSLTLNTAVR